MKAEELMIGDWVVGNNKQPFQIGTIDPSFRYWDEIEPISLTPEILEKNEIKLFSTYTHPYSDCGWEEGELEEEMKHYPMSVYQILDPYITFVIRPDEQELKVRSSDYKTIIEKKEEVIFVHELQHALKMCGIEKEIVL